MTSYTRFGLFAPSDTSRAIVDRLNTALAGALNSKDVRDGILSEASTPEDESSRVSTRTRGLTTSLLLFVLDDASPIPGHARTYLAYLHHGQDHIAPACARTASQDRRADPKIVEKIQNAYKKALADPTSLL